MFYIRVDANADIATGHVMRCMTIAKEIVTMGQEVTFLTADRQSHDLILDNGYHAVSLDTRWNHMEEELPKMISLIEQWNIETVLIDSYSVTAAYLRELRKHTKVIYIDDVYSFSYPVDVLINYNIYANQVDYNQLQRGMNTKLLLGCKYAPLRSDFRGIQKKYGEKVKRVLISTGGADSHHVALKLLKFIGDGKLLSDPVYEDIEYHIIVGKFNRDLEELSEIEKTHKNIVLHRNVKNMHSLMEEADIAITAGGSTMYELCASGVPMLIYTFTDHQLDGAREFEKLGLATYCGDIRKGEALVWEHIQSSMKGYCSSKELRYEIGKKMQEYIDGKGAIRLARELLQ